MDDPISRLILVNLKSYGNHTSSDVLICLLNLKFVSIKGFFYLIKLFEVSGRLILQSWYWSSAPSQSQIQDYCRGRLSFGLFPHLASYSLQKSLAFEEPVSWTHFCLLSGAFLFFASTRKCFKKLGPAGPCVFIGQPSLVIWKLALSECKPELSSASTSWQQSNSIYQEFTFKRKQRRGKTDEGVTVVLVLCGN